jgi:hypothetical protein
LDWIRIGVELEMDWEYGTKRFRLKGDHGKRYLRCESAVDLEDWPPKKRTAGGLSLSGFLI